VDLAEVGLALGVLPALLLLAAVHLFRLLQVLPEVQTLRRVDLAPHSQLEVLVGDLPILVQVELVEQVLELLVGEVQPPMLEVEPELFRQNGACLLHVEVHEGLPEGLPLELDLVQDSLLQDALVPQLVLGDLALMLVQVPLTFLEVLVELRILDGIVPKVEPLGLVDTVPHPLGKVCVADLPLLL